MSEQSISEMFTGPHSVIQLTDDALAADDMHAGDYLVLRTERPSDAGERVLVRRAGCLALERWPVEWTADVLGVLVGTLRRA
jgi:hypothetical protein